MFAPRLLVSPGARRSAGPPRNRNRPLRHRRGRRRRHRPGPGRRTGPWPATRSCPGRHTPGLRTRPGLPGAMRAVPGAVPGAGGRIAPPAGNVPGCSLPLSHHRPLTDPLTDTHTGYISLSSARGSQRAAGSNGRVPRRLAGPGCPASHLLPGGWALSERVGAVCQSLGRVAGHGFAVAKSGDAGIGAGEAAYGPPRLIAVAIERPDDDRRAVRPPGIDDGDPSGPSQR